ncbi:putative KHG/KDPG aldolase [Lachnospiraceae bacterium]|nr:putative KHG/KDPG aldolase [Lachnospiraceae bacterium]
MRQEELLANIKEKRLVPVVKLDRTEDAKPLCEALCQGGLPVAEITFRTEAAEESIRTASREFPEMIVGAGTVINVEQARRAVDAGASFLVSPGISREVTEWALKNQICIFPGTCTPTEIMIALEYELPVVKFFPASQYGGLETIKALAAPFPGISFMPTGGIGVHNIKEYLAFKKVAACGGSWMVKDTFIKEGSFDKIRELTREAAALINEEGVL